MFPGICSRVKANHRRDYFSAKAAIKPQIRPQKLNSRWTSLVAPSPPPSSCDHTHLQVLDGNDPWQDSVPARQAALPSRSDSPPLHPWICSKKGPIHFRDPHQKSNSINLIIARHAGGIPTSRMDANKRGRRMWEGGRRVSVCWEGGVITPVARCEGGGWGSRMEELVDGGQSVCITPLPTAGLFGSPFTHIIMLVFGGLETSFFFFF